MDVTKSRTKTKRSWVDLIDDLLCLVIMQLSVIDFVAFSGTCKTWLLFARTKKKKFMESRLPMTIRYSTKVCCLYNYQNRKFKSVLPHSRGRMCVGVSCGYLILFGRKTRDFWLVNPLTRKELHFHNAPFRIDKDPSKVRAILVYSPLMFEWVFVISFIHSNKIWFCSADKKDYWDNLDSDLVIHDLHVFKGKIYIMYGGGCRLYEMRLHPYPILKQLVMKNPPKPVAVSKFISSGENLFVFRYYIGEACAVFEIDFEKMIWVSAENTIGGEYAFFMCELKSGAAIKPETLVESEMHYHRLVYLVPEKIRVGRSFTRHMWYFPNDCLNRNRLRE